MRLEKISAIFVLSIFIIMAIGSNAMAANLSLEFVYPTDPNGAHVGRTWTYVNVTVNDTQTPNNLTAFIDWNRSLVLWMRFNNETGESSTLFRDWSSWSHNGTCSGSSCPVNTTGKFGNALQFDGINDYVDAGNDASLLPPNITVSVWFRATALPGSLLGNQKSAPYEGYNVGVGLNTPNKFGMWVGDSSWVESISSITTGVLYHGVATYNGTSVSIYINGVLEKTTAQRANFNTTTNLFIGKVPNGNNFNGTIDEVQIWNRVLSPEEINASFNAGSYRLYHNITGLADGNYDYTAYAQDLSGNVNKTETRTLTVSTIPDKTPPSITFVSPTWNNNSQKTENWEYVNITLNENGGNALLEWSNGTLANYTMSGSGTNFYRNMTSQNGTITYKVYANDISGNMNVSETRTVTLNHTAPSPPLSISFVSPTDVSGAYVNRTWTYVSVTVDDSDTPNNLTAFIDFNRSLVGWWRFNNEIGENSTFFKDWSSYGNNGTCSGSTCPVNASGKFGSALQFDGVDDYVNIPQIPSGDYVDSYTYEMWINPNKLKGWQGLIGQSYWRNTLALNGNALTYIDTNDAGVPTEVSTTLPSSNTWYHVVATINSSKIMKLYVNGTLASSAIRTGDKNESWDEYGIGRVQIYDGGWTIAYFNGMIDDIKIWNKELSPEEIRASYNAGLYRLYHNFTDLSEATYNYTVYAQNANGNVNSVMRKVTVDKLPPLMTVSSPLNVTYVFGNPNLSVSTDTDVPQVWYSIDKGTNITACYNCSSYDETLTALSDGNHNITVWSNNSLGHINSTFKQFVIKATNSLCINGTTYGDLTIVVPTTCSDIEMVRYGNTSIQSDFTLKNVTLKIASDDTNIYSLTIESGNKVNIINSSISSWNGTDFDRNSSDGRSYVVIKSKNSEITNSRISFLGFGSCIYPNTNCGVSVVDYSTITNSTFSNNSVGLYGINVLVKNNSFYDNDIGVKLSYSVIQDNYFSNNAGGIIETGTGSIVSNNILENVKDYSGFFIKSVSAVDSLIYNNSMRQSNCSNIISAIYVSASSNVTVQNNIVNTADIGLSMFSDNNNDKIINNTFINMTCDTDSYSVGLDIRSTVSNLLISGNNFSKIGHIGIEIRGNINNTRISNNTFDMLLPSELPGKYVTIQRNMPPEAISIIYFYSKWGTPGTSDDKYISKEIKNNITILNNIFDNDTSVFLYTEGVTNLTHDLTDYWQRSVNFPRLQGIQTYYINNIYDELLNYGDPYKYYTGEYPNNIFSMAHGWHTINGVPSPGWAHYVYYTVSKNNLSFAGIGVDYCDTGGMHDCTPNPIDETSYKLLLINPSYTAMLSKNTTIYSNGTSEFTLYNDSVWYSAVKMTIVPSSDSVVVNVSKWNSIGDYFKKWNESSTNSSVTTSHVIGDFPSNTKIDIKKNGAKWHTYTSNSTGYITFTYNDGYSQIHFEATLSSSNDYIPPSPTNLAETHGNFWVNNTWRAGSGNITNSYNVRHNGTWSNGTANTYFNASVGAHGWSNITVYAFNISGNGTINTTGISQNTRVPNNNPVQQSIGNKSVNEGQWLNFTISSTDVDNDALIYRTNATRGSLTQNNYSWEPTYSDAGI
ncbi:MAG: LamG domain-containing protein, partial [Candidatus Methanoperedens sp.]|nr:LamG domain-containing protein [Candidatus Methanoperedens sp.]